MYRLLVPAVATVCGTVLAWAPISAGYAQPAAPAARQTVIVELKPSLPAADVVARRTAAFQAESPVTAAITRGGGRIGRRLGLIDAVVASVTPTEAAALATRPDVAAVVPNRTFSVAPPAPVATRHAPRPVARSSRPSGTSAQDVHDQLCTTDPATPQLEPEALSLIRANSDDPATPSAANLATGHGVSIGILADGIDPDNADLIRPDGSHVIGDYQDFTGDGTAATTNTVEGFIDADSIAAQGQRVFTLSPDTGFYNVPAGCTARVVGAAPGATVDVARIIGSDGVGTYAEVVEAIDHLVEDDHVDILSESVGDAEYPYDRFDPVAQADKAALAAGVTVLASTGDAGAAAEPQSPAEVPGVIGVGASTQLRALEQAGYIVPSGPWIDGQTANLSSSGIAQDGKTLDLVAPGEVGIDSCTAAARYPQCPSTGIELIDGTSESTPLVAGVAALVLQTYRAHHGGKTPSPAVVRHILTGTAHDLGNPASEQGAGQVDALRAVHLAAAWDRPGPGGIASNPTQLDETADVGASSTRTLHLTNHSTATKTVSLTARAEQRTGGLDTDATLQPVDGFGLAFVSLAVPAGVDRLAVTMTWADPAQQTYLAPDLYEPDGTVAADNSLPQGPSNNVYFDVAHPPAGTWSLELYSPSYFGAGVPWLGAVHVHTDFLRDTVTPVATVHLRPGGTRSVPVTLPAAATADDGTAEVVIADRAGGATSLVPVAVRRVIAIHGGTGSFDGTLIGGDGRNDGSLTAATFDLDVPRRQPGLDAQIAVPAEAGLHMVAYLVDPSGIAVDEQTNLSGGVAQPAIDLHVVDPTPGRWRLTFGVTRIFPGTSSTISYQGVVRLAGAAVSATGLLDPSPITRTTPPTGSRPVNMTTATIHVHNTTAATHSYVADPRLNGLDWSSLAVPSGLQVPTSTLSALPTVTVPPLTRQVTVSAVGSVPLRMDIDPAGLLEAFDAAPADADLRGATTARVSLAGNPLTVGRYYVTPDHDGIAPVGGWPPSPITVHAKVLTAPFATTVSSSTGDPWIQASITPLTLAPGASGDITVTFSQPGPHSGVIAVEAYDPNESVASTLALLPWRYRS